MSLFTNSTNSVVAGSATHTHLFEKTHSISFYLICILWQLCFLLSAGGFGALATLLHLNLVPPFSMPHNIPSQKLAAMAVNIPLHWNIEVASNFSQL